MNMKLGNVVKMAALLLILFTSCRTIKNTKAVNRVLSNSELLEKVGRTWEKSNPCVNDTIHATVSDTVYDTKFYGYPYWPYDSLGIGKPYIDSLLADSATKPETIVKLVTRTIRVRDTAFVTDNRRLNIVTDSLNFYKGLLQASILRGDNLENQVNTLKEERKSVVANLNYLWKSLLSKWWFWLIVIAFLAYITRKLWLPGLNIPFLK